MSEQVIWALNILDGLLLMAEGSEFLRRVLDSHLLVVWPPILIMTWVGLWNGKRMILKANGERRRTLYNVLLHMLLYIQHCLCYPFHCYSSWFHWKVGFFFYPFFHHFVLSPPSTSLASYSIWSSPFSRIFFVSHSNHHHHHNHSLLWPRLFPLPIKREHTKHSKKSHLITPLNNATFARCPSNLLCIRSLVYNLSWQFAPSFPITFTHRCVHYVSRFNPWFYIRISFWTARDSIIWCPFLVSSFFLRDSTRISFPLALLCFRSVWCTKVLSTWTLRGRRTRRRCSLMFRCVFDARLCVRVLHASI